jgi:hypothetical protein
MTAAEYEYHESNNRKNLQAALNQSPQAKAEAERNAEVESSKALWERGEMEGKNVDLGQWNLEQQIFALRFPQFIGTEANLCAMAEYFQEHGLHPTGENCEKAFRALAVAGKLTLNPSAVGLGDETEMSGPSVRAAIRNRKGFERILDPIQEVAESDAEAWRIARLSAAEYLRENPGADGNDPNAVPAIIKARWHKIIETFKVAHPEYKPTEENRNKVVGWLVENKLTITSHTLEMAYAALKDQLELTHGISSHQVDRPRTADSWLSSVLFRGRQSEFPPIGSWNDQQRTC